MKVILYITLGSLWLYSVFEIYKNGCDRVESSLASSLTENENHLGRLFEIAGAYNNGIKQQMEMNLDLTKNVVSYEHPLLTQLKDYPDLGVYGLGPDSQLGSNKYFASLTGFGSVEQIDQVDRRELSAALSLSLSAPLKSNYYEFFWSYYLSLNEFILISPKVDIKKFRFSKKLHAQPYWVAALPENNPEKDTIFSGVFEDEAGQGLIMTIATPVYDTDTFTGVVALDLGLSFLKSELRPYSDSLSNSMSVVTEDGVLVVSAMRDDSHVNYLDISEIKNSQLSFIHNDDSSVISSRSIAGNFYVAYHLSPKLLRGLVIEEVKHEVFIASLITITVGLLVRLGYALSYSRNQSRYDGLSQVYNRSTLDFTSNKAFSLAQKKKEVISIIIIDIDDFKEINDQYGHQVGDNGIRFVTKKIVDNVRKTDIVGRYGGEEFVVTLPDTGLQEALKIAEKIRQDVERSVFDNDKFVTISAGCAECDTAIEDSSFLKLCERADLALYRSKNGGKNRVLKYSSDSEQHDKRRKSYI